MRYWLLKNEEADFSISDFQRARLTEWNGVRNFQARNYIREMRPGDVFIYYHSNGNPSGAAGVGKVASAPYVDPTQFNKKSMYFERRATKDAPVWLTVRVRYMHKFSRVISLAEIARSKKLKGILVAKRGQRLSVMPLTHEHFEELVRMGQ